MQYGRVKGDQENEKIISIFGVVLLSGWTTINMKILDNRGLIAVEKILAENGHTSRLVRGSVIPDGANMVAFVVKTSKGSTPLRSSAISKESAR
jgi:hypothetical protein